jgi:lipopolysaccharide/colanic/teichoic acid biosynthesis glycosyltransferase
MDDRRREFPLDDDRVTRVGHFIRKVRIVELPRSLSVFRGRMTFLEPRSQRPEFVARLADTILYYQNRHSVKPGNTGRPQFCHPYGSSEQNALEKLRYNLCYMKNHILAFDIFILLQMVVVVLLAVRCAFMYRRCMIMVADRLLLWYLTLSRVADYADRSNVQPPRPLKRRWVYAVW